MAQRVRGRHDDYVTNSATSAHQGQPLFDSSGLYQGNVDIPSLTEQHGLLREQVEWTLHPYHLHRQVLHHEPRPIQLINDVSGQSTRAARYTAYPRLQVVGRPHSVPVREAEALATTINGRSQRDEGGPSHMDRATALQEARHFLEELEKGWGPKRAGSFSADDVTLLQNLFGTLPKSERKQLKSLLHYSGNKPEFVRTAIQRFAGRMRHKLGFTGTYHPQSGQNLSRILEDYFVVKMANEPKYTTSTCGRSKCHHCSTNRNGNRNQSWRTWQHIMICLSSSIQSETNVWFCFESKCSKSFTSSENLTRHRQKCHSASQHGPISTVSSTTITLTARTEIPTTPSSNPMATQVADVSQPEQHSGTREAPSRTWPMQRENTQTSLNAPSPPPWPPLTSNMWLSSTSSPTSTPSAPHRYQLGDPPISPSSYIPQPPNNPSHHLNYGAFLGHFATSTMRTSQQSSANLDSGGFGHGSTTPTTDAQSTANSLTQPNENWLDEDALWAGPTLGLSENTSRPPTNLTHAPSEFSSDGTQYPHPRNNSNVSFEEWYGLHNDIWPRN